LVTLRRILFFLFLVLLALAAAVFAYSNPDSIAIDIGIMRFEEISMSVAFAGAFALGWVFGLICAGVALLGMARERRRLRRDIQFAEAEIQSLRSMPLQDAN